LPGLEQKAPAGSWWSTRGRSWEASRLSRH